MPVLSHTKSLSILLFLLILFLFSSTGHAGMEGRFDFGAPMEMLAKGAVPGPMSLNGRSGQSAPFKPKSGSGSSCMTFLEFPDQYDLNYYPTAGIWAGQSDGTGPHGVYPVYLKLLPSGWILYGNFDSQAWPPDCTNGDYAFFWGNEEAGSYRIWEDCQLETGDVRVADCSAYNFAPDPGFFWKPDIFVQYVGGGEPGEDRTSLAVGPDDTIYLVVQKGGMIFLYSKSLSATGWSREIVDHFGDLPALALDDSGAPHISYYDTDNLSLKYATKTVDGDWQITVVDDAGDVGQDSDIALDANGAVHISYWEQDDMDLKYATNASGDWVAQTAITDYDIGLMTSIALDPEGYVHISCTDYGGLGEYHLIYVTNASGQWEYEVLDAYSWTSSIAVDENGAVHISYERYTA